ncbi:MAG: minor capsid protein [Alphaproteobacteria bacterium]
MKTANEEILDRQIHHAIEIERFKTGTVRKMYALMQRAETDLINKLAARLVLIEDRGHDLGKASTARLDKLLKEVRDTRKALFDALYIDLSGDVIAFAGDEVEFQAKLPETIIGASLGLSIPQGSALRTIVLSQPFQGRILKEWAKGVSSADINRITDRVKIGIVEGQTTDQIVRAIRGTKARNYRDGVLLKSRRDIESVVRTSINHVANRAREQLWSANDNIIAGVQWVSTLDSKTSSICYSRDGKIYAVNSGVRPPAHFNCRSIMVAYFAETIVGTRASSIGAIPQKRSFQDWLKLQNIEVQEDVLGVRKAKLFRQGGLKLDRFVDRSGKELTLADMRSRNKDVYERILG